VTKASDYTWKSKSKKVGKKILEFDYNNKTFKNIINNELKKKLIK